MEPTLEKCTGDQQDHYGALVRACLDLLPDMPTGYEVSGQTMDTTMRQERIRAWRKAVIAAARDRVLTSTKED